MRRKQPKWITNEYDNPIPVCPYCDEPYGDGDIFNVKNYPDDGGAVMFLICEDCGRNKAPQEEAQLIFDWEVLKERKRQ